MFVDGKNHCFGCVFQDVETVTQEDGTDFPEQTGCCVGRLEQYRANGVEIEEAYNEEQNYYVIPGKKCSMYRTKNWAIKTGKNYIADWEKLAEEEIMGRLVDVIVPITTGTDMEDIKALLSQLEKQKGGHPALVHLMLFAPDKCVPSEYIKLLSKYKFKWKFHHLIDETMSYGDIINRVGDKCDSYYYAIFHPGFDLPINFVERLFNRTYKKLQAFSLAEPATAYSGVIVQSKAHKIFQGNGKEKSVDEKIKELAEEQKLPHMVIEYGDLF